MLYAELVYPFEGRPASLTVVPPLGEGGISKVPIGFITYHRHAPVHDFRYLSEASTLTLDWQDPWYSFYDKKALKRWQRGGVMSFLYVEPYEVRHEILARVKDLEAWMDLGLRGDRFVEADENETLKRRVGEFFLKHDNVLIDGRRLRPILDRTAFVKYAMTGSTFLIQPERLPISTAMVGVIITYVTGAMPREVTSEWTLWSDRIQKVPADAIDPAGPFPSYLTPDSNVLTWTNYLKKYTPPTVARIELDQRRTTIMLPWASLVCLLAMLPLAWRIAARRRHREPIRRQVGWIVLCVAAALALYPVLQVPVARPEAMAPKLEEKEAVVLLESLLKNIYRSFDFREEEDVYDRLATSVHGELLSDIYLQNRKSMTVAQAGGARARVKQIDIQDVDVHPAADRPLGLRFDARWTALGTVGHWGHIHSRKNQYHADITVEPMDGAWKITALELLEEKRIDPFARPPS